MTTVHGTWSDERLDDLAKKVDDGFARVDREMAAGFARVDRDMKEGFAAVDRRFERLEDRFDELNRTLLRGGIGIIGAIVAALISNHV